MIFYKISLSFDWLSCTSTFWARPSARLFRCECRVMELKNSRVVLQDLCKFYLNSSFEIKDFLNRTISLLERPAGCAEKEAYSLGRSCRLAAEAQGMLWKDVNANLRLTADSCRSQWQASGRVMNLTDSQCSSDGVAVLLLQAKIYKRGAGVADCKISR